MNKLLLVGTIGIWATAGPAHSPLDASMPADGSTIAVAPEEVTFDFKNDIRLTRVTMTHVDDPSVDLDLSGQSGFVADYAVPVEAMGSGVYLIEWRGLGADGHALNGTFSFTVE